MITITDHQTFSDIPSYFRMIGAAATSSNTRLRQTEPLEQVRGSWNAIAAGASFAAIVLHLILRYALHQPARISSTPLWLAITMGGLPLLYDLLIQLTKRQFGADFLAGLSIITAALLHQPLVAAIIILMLTGGQVLEEFATQHASSLLDALAHRMPSTAHRIGANGISDIAIGDIRIGDRLIVLPHEICPVDGTVKSGSGTMDESFLTGEPFRIRKTSGSQVLSGALNEECALVIAADKLAVDSRYARIMEVMKRAEERPPAIRRISDRLGALYTPAAVLVALAGWLFSGQPERFLAVLVIATPCPLLLAIPVSIVGAISLAAKRGIVIKKPAVLEQVGNIRAMFFDKTGTLTHGEPIVTEVVSFSGASIEEVLRFSASLEQYSKHPLAGAILRAAEEHRVNPQNADNITEIPGAGLQGSVEGVRVLITGRQKLRSEMAELLPPNISGMECVVLIDGQISGLIRFHDNPRRDSKPFISHLRSKHHVEKLVILSGDRHIEAQHLASLVGIEDVRASLTPEQKLEIVKNSTTKMPTLFIGDGINDAPAMLAATVGIAFGLNSDITAEAAGAVIMDPNLGKVDELLHIGNRMRRIALESAVGGMVLSGLGMFLAAFGLLTPIAGAVGQEIIDLLAVLNALRASVAGTSLRDF